MIVACNNNIKEVQYSGFTIDKIYACGGQLVYSADTTPHDYSQDYFTVKAYNGDFYFKHSNPSPIAYSSNGGVTWRLLDANEYNHVTPPCTVLFKTLAESEPSREAAKIDLVSHIGNGQMEVCGNILSMVYGDDFRGKSAITPPHSSYFANYFSGNTELISSENLVLPLTTLTMGCYHSMFKGCSAMTATTAILPATTLETYCYNNMYSGCTSLVKAPELPAPTLVNSCYEAMFTDCSSLNYIKCLATDVSANNCTNVWTYGVASNGTFIKDANMGNWQNNWNGIPNGWTVTDA